MPDLFDELVAEPQKKDIFDELTPETPERDIFDDLAPETSTGKSPEITATPKATTTSISEKIIAPTRDRNAESGYRDIASRFLGRDVSGQRLAGQDPGTYEGVKGGLNERYSDTARVSEALGKHGGDIDAAITDSQATTKRLSEGAKYVQFGGGGMLTESRKEQERLATQLTSLKSELDAAGVPAAERPRIIQDAAKANAWTENDSDNIRKLSTGELAINPGRLFGQRDELVKQINASDADESDKQEAVQRLDAMRAASAEKLAGDLHTGDIRLPGAQEFRDFAASRTDKPTSEVLDEWIAQQKNRGAGWKMIDSLVSGVTKGGLGLEKTVVGGLAGAAALTGAPGAETLGNAQQILSGARESMATAEKTRGADGITSDLADTVTQMAPMFVGGAAAQGLQGLSRTAVQGMSVYGWAAAQGYESKLDDAVSMARQAKGSELTPQEVAGVLGDTKTQVAGFLNGFQTAVLSKVLGGGVERAALGQAAKSMTVKDFIVGGGAKALRDGVLKKEIQSMAKTVLKDATDESVEEFTNQVLDEAISTVALGKDMKLGDLLENAAKAGALGGLVGGAIPQVRRSPAENAARDLAADAAAVAPASAAAALEDPGKTKTLANSEESPELSLSDDKEQPAPSTPLELQVPTMPENESGAAPDSAAAVSETGTPPVEGMSGPEVTAPLTDETPPLETPAAAPSAPSAAPEPVPTEAPVPEGVPAAEVQPTSGGPAVAGSEEANLTNENETTTDTKLDAPTSTNGEAQPISKGEPQSLRPEDSENGSQSGAGETVEVSDNPDGTFTIDGRTAKQTQVGGNTRWVVQTEENRQRAERGERQIGGDLLFDTREEAIKETRDEVLRERANAETRAKAATEKSAADAKETERLKPLVVFSEGMTPMQRGKAEKVLRGTWFKRSASTGKEYKGEKFEVIPEMISDGYRPVEDEGTYRFEREDGSGYTINKTEFTYAQHVIENGLPRGSKESNVSSQPDNATQQDASGEARGDESGGGSERTGVTAPGTEPAPGKETGGNVSGVTLSRRAVDARIEDRDPLPAASLNALGMEVPEGYVKRGDLYVYQTSPRQTLLSELGTPADPAFPDKVTTPEGAVLELTADGGKIKASITVPPENRRKGAGTAAMQKLVDLARRDGVTIDLDVEPTGANPEPGMGKEELTSWYAKFGFTDNGDGTMTFNPAGAAPVGENAAEQAASRERNTLVEGIISTLKSGKSYVFRGKDFKIMFTKSSKPDVAYQATYVGADGKPSADYEFASEKELRENSLSEIASIMAETRPDIPDDVGFNTGYDGRTFLYELRGRPAGPGAVPPGFLKSNEGGKYGIAEFDRILTQEEIDNFELKPVGFNEPNVASSEANVASQLTTLDPTPELPNFEAALGEDSVTGLYHAQTDADRARLGLPPRFTQPRTTDQEAWDRATAAEDAHRAAGKPGTAGTDLLTNLLNDVPRVIEKEEHALLLHEKLVREQAVEKSQEKLNNLPATTTDGERKNAQAAVQKAQNEFDLLITYADAAGSRAGLSLQARKMLVNMDFTLAAVVNRLKSAKNMNSDKPTTWTDADQKAAVEIASKLQEAQERVEALEAGNNEQTALIEQLTKDVERAQTKLENRMRQSRARKLVTEKLDPLVEAAKARMAARKGQKPDPNITVLQAFGPSPEQQEDLKDIAIIASGWIANKALTLQEFSSRLVSEFGDWVSEHAQTLFRNARSLYIETAESVTQGGTDAPTPTTVLESIDATEPLDKGDVWKLARAHVIAGKRGRNVLDAVFGDLSQKFPDITRDQVSEAFTGYGTVVYPSDKKVPAELRRIKSLEREYLKQADIAAGLMPKRTGYQGDVKKGPEWAEVRAEQQKSLEALRDLENQLREAGLPVPSDEKKLANALGTMKRRLTNEIEEIELALSSRTPRTPKSRTPITPDAETAALQKKLDEKRAEYEQVFKDESAREKRILGSLKKRRMELERRMNDKDFSRPAPKEPVNTEAKRKADFEFAKVRSKYEEMRNDYLLKNATIPAKAGHYLMSTGNLLKVLVLGGDIGVVMRQLGTTYQAITRDLGMLAPTKEGAKKRADGSYLKKTLSEGVKAFGSREYEHSTYERLMESNNAGWFKLAGLVLSAPFDTQQNAKEDIPSTNLLDKIPWWIWPALAGVKVSLLASSFPVSAALVAASFGTKPLLQALDRAQRAMTNQSRVMFFDEAIGNLHDGHPTVQEAKAIAKAVMVGTGRGTATQKIESAIPFLNQVLLATRYYFSRIQAATLYPLLNKDARSSAAARKEIQRMYARSVTGRAVMYTLAAAAFGKSLAGDDDEPEEGLITDPRNPNFGRVKLADGVSLDFMSGTNGYLSLAARLWTKSRVEPDTGRVVALGSGFTNNALDEATKFLRSKRNMQLSFALNTYSGSYYGGKPVTFGNALEEMTTAIIVNDTFNTYKAMMDEYGPVKGAARATVYLSMMFGGAGTAVRDSEAEKEANAMAKKEAEFDRRTREAELNE